MPNNSAHSSWLDRLSPKTQGVIAINIAAVIFGTAIYFAALFFNEPVTPWIAVSVILILGASLTLLKIEKEHPQHVA